MLKPIARIFKPDTDSLVDCVIEVIVGIPRAVIYYFRQYARAYFLATRLVVVVVALLAGFFALFTVLALTLVLGLVHGFNAPIGAINVVVPIFNAVGFGEFAYAYWRLDGKRLVTDIRQAFHCVW